MGNQKIDRHDWFRAVMQAEGLTPSAKMVAGALAIQFCNGETGKLNPSQETIADYLKIHRDTVKRVLRELRNAGWLIAIGKGGRSKSPDMTLLSPSKIIPFRSRKGVANHPAQAAKRGDDLQQKGGQIAPAHNKDEKALEKEGGLIPTQRHVALDQFMKTRFWGSNFDGPRMVAKSEWQCLNDWGDWLRSHGLPQLIDLPLVAVDEKKGTVLFWLPSKQIPTTPAHTAEALNYFRTLLDWEGARHAAQ